MYEFWYDYVKSKYGKKAKMCYLDTDNFILYIKNMVLTNILQKLLKLDLILEKGKNNRIT